MPDSYRPTLYDFIAHEALQFYTSGEQAAAKPEGRLRAVGRQPHPRLGGEVPGLAARGRRRHRLAGAQGHPPLPGPAPLPPERPGAAPGLCRRRPGAADLGLERGFRRGQERPLQGGAGSLHPHLCRLRHLRAGHRARGARAPAGGRPGRRRASWRCGARELFPQSPGGKLCHNLVTEIEAKSASITTERVWNCFR